MVVVPVSEEDGADPCPEASQRLSQELDVVLPPRLPRVYQYPPARVMNTLLSVIDSTRGSQFSLHHPIPNTILAAEGRVLMNKL